MTDCSLNYKFNTWKFQAQTRGEHVVYRDCFWHSERFLYTTCSPHVPEKEELLTKIYLYENLLEVTRLNWGPLLGLVPNLCIIFLLSIWWIFQSLDWWPRQSVQDCRSGERAQYPQILIQVNSRYIVSYFRHVSHKMKRPFCLVFIDLCQVPKIVSF